MTLSHALQFALLQRRQHVRFYQRGFCRRIMRAWAKCCRQHRADKEQFELAELALGNALAWRDRATWPEEILRLADYIPADAQGGRVMSTPETAGGSSEATSPPALALHPGPVT